MQTSTFKLGTEEQGTWLKRKDGKKWDVKAGSNGWGTVLEELRDSGNQTLCKRKAVSRARVELCRTRSSFVNPIPDHVSHPTPHTKHSWYAQQRRWLELQLTIYTMLFGRYFVECCILIVQFSFCVLKQRCLLKFTIFGGGGGVSCKGIHRIWAC